MVLFWPITGLCRIRCRARQVDPNEMGVETLQTPRLCSDGMGAVGGFSERILMNEKYTIRVKWGTFQFVAYTMGIFFAGAIVGAWLW